MIMSHITYNHNDFPYKDLQDTPVLAPTVVPTKSTEATPKTALDVSAILDAIRSIPEHERAAILAALKGE